MKTYTKEEYANFYGGIPIGNNGEWRSPNLGKCRCVRVFSGSISRFYKGESIGRFYEDCTRCAGKGVPAIPLEELR